MVAATPGSARPRRDNSNLIYGRNIRSTPADFEKIRDDAERR